jgi:U6 snRNA-associated Sm-like protein LSm1
VLLGEIDEEKESQTNLKEVSLEEILEAQSKQQAAKEEQDRLRAKAFKERGLTYTAETAYEDLY